MTMTKGKLTAATVAAEIAAALNAEDGRTSWAVEDGGAPWWRTVRDTARPYAVLHVELGRVSVLPYEIQESLYPSGSASRRLELRQESESVGWSKFDARRIARRILSGLLPAAEQMAAEIQEADERRIARAEEQGATIAALEASGFVRGGMTDSLVPGQDSVSMRFPRHDMDLTVYPSGSVRIERAYGTLPLSVFTAIGEALAASED